MFKALYSRSRAKLPALSLRIKLGGVFIGLVVVLAATLSAAMWASHRASQAALAQKFVDEVSVSISAALGDYANEAHLAANSLLSLNAVAAGTLADVQKLRKYLLTYASNAKLAKYVYVGLESGQFVGVEQIVGTPDRFFTRTRQTSDTHLISQEISPEGTPIGMQTESKSAYDPRLRSWYQRAAASRAAVWTEPYLSASKGIMVMTYALPIVESGALLGVIGVDFTLDHITRRLSSLQPTANTVVQFRSEQGAILAASTTHPLDPDVAAYVQSNLSKFHQAAQVTQIGEELLLGIRAQSEPVPSAVVVQIPKSELLLEARNIQGWSAFAGVVCVSLALLLGIRMLNSVAHDINAISRSASEIIRGAGITKLPTSRSDEIGELARAFHSMRTRVLEHRTAGRADHVESMLRTRHILPQEDFSSESRGVIDSAQGIRIATAIDGASEAIAIVSETNIIVYANGAFADMFRSHVAALVGSPWTQLLTQDSQDESIERLVERVRSSNASLRKIVRARLMDETARFVDVTVSPIRAQGGRFEACILVRDVSAAVARTRALHVAAHRDPVTGLVRRDALLGGLATRISQSDLQPFCVLFIDLDGFKSINDQKGHSTGDAVLIALGDLLMSHMRGDDLASRFGGDEFVLLVSVGRAEQSVQVARRIVREIESLGHRMVGETSALSASIGISQFPLNSDDPDMLIELADSAMYEAKRQGGRGVVVWDETLLRRKKAARAPQRVA